VVFHENPNNCKKRFLFIEGTRPDKVVLVAHADTVWDNCYYNCEFKQEVVREGNYFIGLNPECGIGADDRAGCALIWLLRFTGHSILITDGEERGAQGSSYLMAEFPEIRQQLNAHQFMIQFDRRNSADYKCYEVGSIDFHEYISEQTKMEYNHRTDGGKTDICVLCEDICGVNFSIGYVNEHTAKEKICISDWQHTFDVVSELLEQPNIPRFTR